MNSRFGLSLMAGVACLSAVPALAQDPQPQTSNEGASFGEIVVTANKRQESINDVGMTISAATGEQLAARGIVDTADLGKLVPGFTAQPSPYDTPVYTLRGIGLYEAGFASSPSVAVYVDEVALPFPLMQKGATLDLERVEVLKGPQGTLFGQNATGGAINYIAAKPTDSLVAGGRISYERFGKMDATGYVSGPLGETLKGRLAGRAVQGGAWQKSASRPGDKLGDANELYGRVLLDWEPSDTLRFALNVNGWRDKGEPQAGQMFQIDVNQGASPARRAEVASLLAPSLVTTKSSRFADWGTENPNRKDDSFWQASLRGDLDLTDGIILTGISSYQKLKIDRFIELDGAAAQNLDNNVTGAVDTVSAELRLAGNTDRFSWIVGGSYDKTDAEDRYRFFLRDFAGNQPVGLVFDGSASETAQKIKNRAIFANLEYEIVDRLKIQGGIRYTSSKRHASACSFDPTSTGNVAKTYELLQSLFADLGVKTTPVVPILPGQCYQLTDAPDVSPTIGDTDLELNEHNTSWRGGVNYETGGGTLLYGTVSRGFKSGAITNITVTTESQYVPAVQERVDAYEIGFKAPLLDGGAQFNVAGFYYDYKNKQVRGRVEDPIFGLLETLLNVPKSRIWGIEAEILGRPMDGLNLTLSGTYLNSKVTADFNTFPQGGRAKENVNGSELPYTPKFSGVFDAQYQRPINSSLDAFVGGTFTYQRKSQASLTTATNSFPAFELPEQTLLDLRAGIAAPDGGWRAEVFGRNLTGDTYWTTVFQGTDEVHRYMARPTVYGVAFTFKYN